MKDINGFLKLCNNPYEEKSKKTMRRVYLATTIIIVLIVIFAVMTLFLSEMI